MIYRGGVGAASGRPRGPLRPERKPEPRPDKRNSLLYPRPVAQAAGFLYVVAIVALGAGGVAVVHLLVRARTESLRRASDALRELEPRGGRQRFSVRLFEAALLGCLWVSLTGAALVLLPAGELTALGRLTTFAITGSGGVATWWAWRRGALRSPRSPPMQMEDEAGR